MTFIFLLPVHFNEEELICPKQLIEIYVDGYTLNNFYNAEYMNEVSNYLKALAQFLFLSLAPLSSCP